MRLSGEHALWSNSWDAAGKAITWDMIHYDVQLIGGIAMHQGKIAEMQTGEGKHWSPRYLFTSMLLQERACTWSL